MAWTDVPVKTNGVSNVSKADCDLYVKDNLEHLRAPRSAKVKAEASTTLTTGTATTIDYATVTELWDSDSIHNTAIDHLDLADTRNGVWEVGATVRFDPNTTGDRRLGLVTQSAGTNLARVRSITNEARATRMTADSVQVFTTANDGLETEGLQSSGGNLDAEGEMWALWAGDEDTSSSTVALAHTMLDEDVGVTQWWTNWRSNVFRLYRRPAAKIRKSSAQNLSDSTTAAVTFGTSVFDTAGMVNVGNNDINATYAGYYKCSACVGVQSFNGTNDFVSLQFYVNGSPFAFNTASYEVNTGSSYVTITDVIYLSAGATLSVRATKGTTGGTSAMVTGTESFLSAVLWSGDISSTLAPNRQFFTDGPPDLSSFHFSDPTGAKIPRGLANLYTRDLFCHLWNPPVLSVQAETNGNALQGEGWTDLTIDETRYDNWGILDSLKTDGGIRLPWDGLYGVVAGADFKAEGVGDTGDRGIRIKQGSRNVSPIRMASATSSSAGWAQTTSGLVNGRKDQVITVQGLSTAGDEVDVRSALLHVVPLRDRVA